MNGSLLVQAQSVEIDSKIFNDFESAMVHANREPTVNRVVAFLPNGEQIRLRRIENQWVLEK
jgi:hypothetical protein